jgi:hypothetical protein
MKKVYWLSPRPLNKVEQRIISSKFNILDEAITQIKLEGSDRIANIIDITKNDIIIGEFSQEQLLEIEKLDC